MLGALLAFASAATFGLNSATLRRGVLTGSVLQAMAITVPLGLLLFAVVCVPTGGFIALAEFPLPSWAWLTLAGVVHLVIGRYGNYRATQAVGAALSSPVQQLSVPVSLVLALFFLNEVLTPLRVVGFVLVMVGPLLATAHSRPKAEQTPAGAFRPQYREGVIWGLVCAVGYGTSPLFIVKGLGSNRTLIDSLAGGMISYGAASVIVLILISFAGGAALVRHIDATARRWFLLSGFLVFLSQMFRYMALAIAPVSVVVPIQRLSVIFRILFGWILNRRHEALGPSVLAGVAVSLLGAIALTLSTEIILVMLPFDWVVALTTGWP
ncbi:MAG: EamA family transporter [Woeseia sp.]